jgi:predicted tellurium resistance membrane protein TerC
MLALSFLLLIGVALIADGLGFHIPRAYIYFAMAFSAGVELFNVLARRNRRRHNQLIPVTNNRGTKPRKKRRK